MSHVHRCTQSDFVFSTIYGDAEANSTITWLQSLREAMPLPASFIQGNIRMSLVTAGHIPICLGVAHQPNFGHKTASSKTYKISCNSRYA